MKTEQELRQELTDLDKELTQLVIDRDNAVKLNDMKKVYDLELEIMGANYLYDLILFDIEQLNT